MQHPDAIGSLPCMAGRRLTLVQWSSWCCENLLAAALLPFHFLPMQVQLPLVAAATFLDALEPPCREPCEGVFSYGCGSVSGLLFLSLMRLVNSLSLDATRIVMRST